MTAETPEQVLARVAGEHVRGTWSDHTYACQGCAQRYEEEAQARFDALSRPPTKDEMTEFRTGYSKVSHPRWTLDEYADHLATAQVAALRDAGLLPPGPPTETVEWGERFASGQVRPLVAVDREYAVALAEAHGLTPVHHTRRSWPDHVTDWEAVEDMNREDRE